jgi:hypothetical protein
VWKSVSWYCGLLLQVFVLEQMMCGCGYGCGCGCSSTHFYEYICCLSLFSPPIQSMLRYFVGEAAQLISNNIHCLSLFSRFILCVRRYFLFKNQYKKSLKKIIEKTWLTLSSRLCLFDRGRGEKMYTVRGVKTRPLLYK